MEIAYLQNISKSELSKQFLMGVSKNLDADELDRVGESLAYFTELLTDVELDDRHAFTYIPSQGTQIELNGVKLAVIEGELFARGIFAMYIGTKPLDSRLKPKLLGSLEYYQ